MNIKEIKKLMPERARAANYAAQRAADHLILTWEGMERQELTPYLIDDIAETVYWLNTWMNNILEDEERRHEHRDKI